MRQNLIICQKHLVHYKKLYAAECKLSLSLHKKNAKMAKDLEMLSDEIKVLNRTQEASNIKKAIIRKRTKKNWDDITSERTKRRRYSQYRNIIFEALCQIGVCHRAEIDLWFSKNHVHFSWCPEKF